MDSGSHKAILTGLHAFLSAAEHGSFSHAAEHLAVPQSSVTRQIAALEERLGCRLFERHRRGVTLTPEGIEYHAEVKPAYERILAASRRMRRRDKSHELLVRIYPTFAARWLIRRMPSFNIWAPGVRLSLDVNVAAVDFDRADVDIAIQFGDGRWPNATAEFIFGDEIEPVCSPQLIAEHGPLETVADLSKVLLLQSRYRRDDWKAWLEANTELWPQIRTMEFHSSVLTYQACLDGLGVAMGQTLLLQQELAEGKLVRPLGRPLTRPHLGYYLVSPSKREMSAAARKFRNWLFSEAHGSGGTASTMSTSAG
ncbi:MAG: LysR family transcriptional regulator [Alphaproteobacteria bacterium HGW-Alphaproteobacteria-5]|jgi:LysR family glycine cleavage system transcriptional activator|nr:MAG: LysR family transcriptional regulator [Alphaproteobacteria bacterium HGW-Alphaproteobacteria-5]